MKFGSDKYGSYKDGYKYGNYGYERKPRRTGLKATLIVAAGVIPALLIAPAIFKSGTPTNGQTAIEDTTRRVEAPKADLLETVLMPTVDQCAESGKMDKDQCTKLFELAEQIHLGTLHERSYATKDVCETVHPVCEEKSLDGQQIFTPLHAGVLAQIDPKRSSADNVSLQPIYLKADAACDSNTPTAGEQCRRTTTHTTHSSGPSPLFWYWLGTWHSSPSHYSYTTSGGHHVSQAPTITAKPAVAPKITTMPRMPSINTLPAGRLSPLTIPGIKPATAFKAPSFGTIGRTTIGPSVARPSFSTGGARVSVGVA